MGKGISEKFIFCRNVWAAGRRAAEQWERFTVGNPVHLHSVLGVIDIDAHGNERSVKTENRMHAENDANCIPNDDLCYNVILSYGQL